MDDARLKQQQIDRSETGKQLPHPNGANKRRQHERDQNQPVKQSLAGKFVAHQEKSQREAEQSGKRSNRKPKIDVVGEEGYKIRGGENQLKEDKRKTIRRKKGIGENVTEGIEHESAKEQPQKNQHGGIGSIQIVAPEPATHSIPPEARRRRLADRIGPSPVRQLEVFLSPDHAPRRAGWRRRRDAGEPPA